MPSGFRPLVVFLTALCVSFSGCGYTRKAVLPKDIRSIHVDTVKNKISIGSIHAYQAGLEMKITNAVIRQLLRDGNLKVLPRDRADAVLESSLVAFDQEGVRFNTLERVSEYRFYLVLDMKLKERKTGAILWEEPRFSGDAEYFVSGFGAIARAEAAERAVERLARNVVDRVVEDW